MDKVITSCLQAKSATTKSLRGSSSGTQTGSWVDDRAPPSSPSNTMYIIFIVIYSVLFSTDLSQKSLFTYIVGIVNVIFKRDSGNSWGLIKAEFCAQKASSAAMWFMLFIVNILEYDHCKHPQVSRCSCWEMMKWVCLVKMCVRRYKSATLSMVLK